MMSKGGINYFVKGLSIERKDVSLRHLSCSLGKFQGFKYLFIGLNARISQAQHELYTPLQDTSVWSSAPLSRFTTVILPFLGRVNIMIYSFN